MPRALMLEKGIVKLLLRFSLNIEHLKYRCHPNLAVLYIYFKGCKTVKQNLLFSIISLTFNI